jgi:PKD repeat protein
LAAAYPTKNCYFNSYVGFAAVGQRGLEALQYASGMFMEGWAYKTNGTATPGYWDTTRFRQQISDCVTALASFGGKKVIVIDDFNATDTPRRLLRLGAYLLAYDGTANLKEMCRVFDGDANLNYPVEYDNAIAALGNPLSVRTDDGTLLYRNYQYGRVIVNPSANDVVTSVSGRAEKMTISGSTAWNNLGSTSWSESSGSVTVPARSSLVLRYRPVSSFTRTPKIATPPATVTVNASGSSDQAQGTLEYNTDFGSGYVGWQDSAVFTKLFESAGTFSISVKARNKTTGLDSNASSLSVVLTEDGISGQAPLTVTLDVSGSIGAVGLTYQFDFDEGNGPGNWSSTPTATHVYNSPGTFHPRVRAQTPDGVVGAWFSTVVVVS